MKSKRSNKTNKAQNNKAKKSTTCNNSLASNNE